MSTPAFVWYYYAAMSNSEKIIAEIKAGAASLGIAPSTLCKKAVRNGRLVKRLAAGESVTVDTLERLREYIRANRPDPSMVDRPFGIPFD